MKDFIIWLFISWLASIVLVGVTAGLFGVAWKAFCWVTG